MTPRTQRALLGLGVVLVSWLVSGCKGSLQGSQAPASPAGIQTTVGNGSVVFYRWQEGPTVMIWSDVTDGSSSSGASAGGPPWHCTVNGYKSAPDGRRFEWRLTTTDGQTVQCFLDGKEYDLSQGTLFLVKTKGGKTEIEQLKQDLTAVQPDAESCKEFAEKDPAVSKFLGQGDK
jgi:hypothetical protein